MRFNTFHDQLLLTGSSDARVLLTSAASISSEAPSQSPDKYLDANEDIGDDNTDKDVLKTSESGTDLGVSDSDATPEHNSGIKEKSVTFLQKYIIYDVHHHVFVFRLSDGMLQCYEQHEDSVYCAEWSSADPWTFASLSYDGRLVISRVPRHYKYKILL